LNRGKTEKPAENTPSAETEAVESAGISEIDVTTRAMRYGGLPVGQAAISLRATGSELTAAA